MGLLGAAIRGGQNVARQAAPRAASRPAARPAPIGRSLGRVAQIAHSVMPQAAPQRRVVQQQHPVGVFAQPIRSQALGHSQKLNQQRSQAQAQMQPGQAAANKSQATRYAQARFAYAIMARRDFQRAKPYLPSGAKQPALHFLPLGKINGRSTVLPSQYAAFVWPGTKRVNVDPSTALTAVENVPIFGPGAKFGKLIQHQKDYNQQVPIHEYAHVFQGPQAFTDKARTEGGAEAFKQYVTKRVGMPRTAAPGYQDYVRAVKRLGPQFYLKGQFKGGPR